jgi:lysophospholipase L1-like esterase
MIKRFKILIAADSIAMPREENKYENTWPYMLKEAFPDCDIIDRSSRGSTTARLVNEGGGGVDLLERYNPHIVIIQMGMAECAPRLFKKTGFEHFYLTRIIPQSYRLKYVNFIKKRRIRSPEITDVSPDQFRSNITNYFDRAEKIGTRIIVVLMHGPNRIFFSKSPYIGKNIDLYNRIYKETALNFSNVETIEPFEHDVDIDALTLDELHLNRQGALLIASKLKGRIAELMI